MNVFRTVGLSLMLAGPAAASTSTERLADTLVREAARLTNDPKGGVLILRRNGRVVFNRPFGAWTGGDASREYPVWSVSKSFTAAAAMALAADHRARFAIDDSVADHMPAAATIPAARTITVRHLLSMTSGLPRRFPKNSCVNDRTVTLEACASALLAMSQAAPAETSPPGSVHEYSGASWTVLGATMAAAYNRMNGTELPFADVIDRLLFKPCGWPTPRYQATTRSASDNVWVGGGLIATADTGAKLAELLRTGRCGDVRAVRLLPEKALLEMRRNQTARATNRNSAYNFSDAKSRRSYGLGFFRSDYEGAIAPSTFVGPGLAGSHVFFNPRRGYSGFLLLSDGQGGFERGDAILDSVLGSVERSPQNRMASEAPK